MHFLRISMILAGFFFLQRADAAPVAVLETIWKQLARGSAVVERRALAETETKLAQFLSTSAREIGGKATFWEETSMKQVELKWVSNTNGQWKAEKRFLGDAANEAVVIEESEIQNLKNKLRNEAAAAGGEIDNLARRRLIAEGEELGGSIVDARFAALKTALENGAKSGKDEVIALETRIASLQIIESEAGVPDLIQKLQNVKSELVSVADELDKQAKLLDKMGAENVRNGSLSAPFKSELGLTSEAPIAKQVDNFHKEVRDLGITQAKANCPTCEEMLELLKSAKKDNQIINLCQLAIAKGVGKSCFCP